MAREQETPGPSLGAAAGKAGREATEANAYTRYTGPLARNQPRQWQPQKNGQSDNRRIAEQVVQKRPNGFRRIRTTEIHQHDRGARNVRPSLTLPRSRMVKI
jgi:hypothetical protein